MLLLGGGFALAKGSDVSSNDSPNVNGKNESRAHTHYGKNIIIYRGGRVLVASGSAVFKITIFKA